MMPEQTNSPEGACKRFECKVIGYPRPSVRWYKDGENITTHRRYKFDNTPDGCFVLIIEKVAPTDQGVYECRAENSEGTAETSALLHVRGEHLNADDDLTSVHSMSFRWLDSQKRPLVIEQTRQDSLDQSDDSVIDINSDTSHSKWEISGESDNSVVNIKTDSNVENIQDNYNELLAEALADIENAGEPKSRRWTADSGITSRGSSLSSEPDISISHESVLEMQKYLHGTSDVIFEPNENEQLNGISSNDTRNSTFENGITEHPKEFRSNELKENKNLLNIENGQNTEMDQGDISILAYELYQEDDIDHHFCTSKKNHVDHMEANINWDTVDDHDASILAGKYLFAHGKDVEADEKIQPLSEWELIKQTGGSLLIADADCEGHRTKKVEEERQENIVILESAGKTLVGERKITINTDKTDDINTALEEDLISRHVKDDLLTAKKQQECFSADLQHDKTSITDNECIQSIIDSNKQESATRQETENLSGKIEETIEHSVASSVETDNGQHAEAENVKLLRKLKIEQSRHLDAYDEDRGIVVSDLKYDNVDSADELIVSADNDDFFDLDVDRSEQIISKKSQQYRRSSAQDSVTSEMVEQLSTKQILQTKDNEFLLDYETKTEKYDTSETVDKVSQCSSTASTETGTGKPQSEGDQLIAGKTETGAGVRTILDDAEIQTNATIQTNDETDSSAEPALNESFEDDESYELDVDRSEQIISKRSRQYRRPSAKDSLTSEMINQLSATQKLTTNDDEISLDSESQRLLISKKKLESDDDFDLDVDRKEEALFARRSSLRKHQTQEMDISHKGLETEKQINRRLSCEPVDIEQLNENMTEPTEINGNTPFEDKFVGDSLEADITENVETSKPSEERPSVKHVLLSSDLTEQKEIDLSLETVEKLSMHAHSSDKSDHVPFEKLSLTDKEEILKQISDVSLIKGRMSRQLKEKQETREGVSSDLTDDTETENSYTNEEVCISEVKDSEKVKEPVVLEKQISRTDETDDKVDNKDLDLLYVQDMLDTQASPIKPTDVQNDTQSSLSEKFDECRVDEMNSNTDTDHDHSALKTLDIDAFENAIVGLEKLPSLQNLEAIKEPTEYLYQAEQVPDEKNSNSRSSIDNDGLEMLDDTKPEVPNIINLIEDVKSKTDIKCKLEEENLTSQEEKGYLKSDPGLVEIDNADLNETEKVIVKEESELITESMIVSDNANANFVETQDIKDISANNEPKAISVSTNVEDGALETEVEALELKQAVCQNDMAAVMDNIPEKLSDESKINVEIEQTTGTDEVDADISDIEILKKAVKVSNLELEQERTDNKENILQKDHIKKDEIEQTKYDYLNEERVKSIQQEASNEFGSDENTEIDTEKKNLVKLVPQQAHKIQSKTDNVTVSEGEPISLQWKISGVPVSEIRITKDGLIVQPDDRVSIETDSDLLTLHIESASVDDDACYSITYGNTGVQEGKILVQVIALETSAQKRETEKTEPVFIVEPTLAKEDGGRRLSIKCSVSGFPLPDVTWYHHGQPLGQGEFWDVYSKDGYHFLANSSSDFLDCEEIVCRVENEAGFIQTVLQLNKKGDEITCEPVQREAACPDIDETSPAAPRVELQLTETNTKNLLPYTVMAAHTDKLNLVTLNEGDRVQLLGTYDTQQWITRHEQQTSKICYVPVHFLQPCVATDVRPEECKNVAPNQINEQINKAKENTALHTPDAQDKPASTMPERRKIVPGSKLHGQEDGKDRDSPTDIESKLGFKENLDKKKDVSDHTLTEYDDGTSRPMFKKRLKTVVTRTGELCQMECIVRGTPLPKVLWLKNNRPLKATDGCQVIADEETNSLVFPEVGEDDVGVYTARAMNVNGSVMCSAELSLEDGRPLPYSESTESPMDLDFTTPSYFFQMSSCQVAEGRLARFDCRVVAYPRPEIVWMRDGKVVESGERFRLLNMNNEIYSLLVEDVQLSDTGRYTCWARNKFGEAMTEAYLNVIALTEQEEEGDMAPKFLTRFYDQQTTEGMATDFRCLIAGKPEPSVTWLLDDIELKDAPGMRQRHKDSMVSLEMKSPKIDQSGQYTCQLRNPLGEATCSAKLTVIEDKLHGKMLPKFLRKFDHLTIKDGEEAKFSCVVVGEPKADIVWMFDHKPIPDSNRRFVWKKDGDTYSLIVKNARIDDTGVITCKAVNDEGEVYCSANLHVRESKYGRETPERLGLKPEQKESKLGYIPTFTKRLQDVQVSEGSTAKFECKVMGIPQPEVTWMKDGRVIPSGGRYHMVQDGDTCYLKIDNVSMSDTGVYTCIVSNNQGKSSSSAALRMEGVPPKDKYVPEKPAVDTYTKKERYTPDRKLEDTYARKTRYTPERYLEDTYAKKGRYTPERFLEDTYAKKRYTPERFFEDTYAKQRYTPERYDDTYAKKSRYAPDYLEDTYGKRYTPDRYNVPESYSQTALKQPYLPSEMKAEAIPKIAYDKPTLLNKTNESVRLSWAPVSTHNLPADSRRVSYIVESRELPSSTWTKIGYNVPGSSYLARNLRPDKEYEFRVRAQNQHGISEPTRSATLEKRVDESRKFTELPEMRAPPRLPTHRPIITDLGEEMVRLAWRPVETYKSKRIPPVSYQVEAKELPGKDWMPISTRLRDTTHYLSELEPDRDYMFRVRAENDFGVSEPTEPLWLPRATVFPGVPISRPQIVEIEPHKAKLSWARVDVPAFGLDEVPLTYMLEVEEPPKDWRTLARDLDDTEYIIEGLKPERDYRFRVRAKTPTGVVSEPSPAVSLYTTLAQIRAPVDRLEVLDYEPDTRSLQLSWQRVEVPPYSSDEEPLLYMLEYQEPPLPDWRPLVTGIPTTRYRVMHLDPDRDYNFRVKALTPYGVSLPSAPLPVTMRQPTAIRHLPEEVTISEVESDSLRLTWRRPMVDLAQPISYQIEMLEPLMADWRPIATRVTDTTYKVTGLKPTSDYQFRVIPFADTRALASTPVVGLTSSPVRPRLQLSEPKIREMGPESVQLSWQPATLPLYQRSRTPIYYGVEMMELPSTTWVPVARKVPDTLYMVTGLRPDRDYKFRVTAETDLASSEPSLAAMLHRKPAPVFPRDEPTIRDFTPSAIMLSWQPAVIPEGMTLPVTTPVFYSVESQSPPGMGAWSTLYARHPAPSVKLSDLRPDLDYLVRIRAHYDDFISEPTLPVYIPRRAAPPRISHEEPYAVDIGTDSVKLQWRSAELPVHIMDYAPVTYRVEAQELPGGNWVTVARGVPHTDFKVTGLNPKYDYCFRIRAENDYGVSDPTRPVTIGRRAVAPVLPYDEPLMYDLAPGSVRLSWRPATLPSFFQTASPVTYTIFVQELPYKNWRPHVKRIPQTWYHISGLNPDKEYNFRVQAENDFGTSKPTPAVYMPRMADYKRPISVPEIDDFDEDLTSVKLHWKPRAGPPFDMGRSKYLIESWEPVKREWFPLARGIPDTSYQLKGLPAAPDHLFRVRYETEQAGLSEPSLPVSVSRFYAKRPVHRPQLYELDTDSVRLSWDSAFIPAGQTRRPVRFIVEMREIPDKTWRQVASDLLDTNYKIRGLRSKYDYEFRVRALIDGESSDPSLPVALYRRSEIPKVRFDVPEVYDVDDDALSLRWNKVDIPVFSYDDEPLSFMIERQTLPGYQWEPVATNLTGTSYRVQDLKPYQDYAFRVRGVYPSGYTEPSPHVPVYRRPIRLSVPIARPEVWEEEPYSARLRWQRAYIPPYYSSLPLRYRIEMQEAGPTASDWQPVATDVTTPDFTVNELSPRKDYNFRIRAEMENGDISEPTPPIQYYRSQLPMSKEPFTLAEYKPVDYEVTFANRTYVEHLTKFVPPRLPIDKPEMVEINPETVELAWKPARVPESIRHSSNLTYTIEVRTPPSFEWRELVSGLKGLNHSVKKLHPRIDYIFRIRAWNEYGCSEPSLPVSFYRPVQHDTNASYEDDEAWEKEWELRFGQQEAPLEAVPPKLPMDTPKIITQSPESIWFSWLPARIPAYATQTPISYIIEVKEPPETSWNPQVKDLVDCQYTYEGMNPTRDYHIRVRAVTQFGPSEPTLPIVIKRGGSRPGSRRSSMERDLKSEDVTVDTTVLDTLTSGVPPRMASNRPLSSNVQPTSLTLSWPAGRVPSYVKSAGISYIIEKREPPGHVWTVLAKDISTTRYDIKGLEAEQDYMFRVRAKNEFGTSEPTLPMTLYRERDDYVPQKIRSRSGSRDSIQALVSRRRRSSSIDFLRADSEELDACVKDKIPTQPEYTSKPKWDTQYGVEGKKGKIVLQVRGYPLPTIHWYLNDEKLDYGDNYNGLLSPSGTVTLEIKLVTADTIGTYKCFAENESGSAVKYVKYEFADPPTVLEPLRDVSMTTHTSGKLTCRVDGFPCPTAKWMKDWHPVKDSSRIKVIYEAPDIWSLEIDNALSSDSGLYACTMENIAGKVTMTARLVVEDQEQGPVEVELKKSPIEDSYHILEEIGRSRQGVIRRVIEKQTGETFAANFIFARNKAQKNFFMTEFEVLRLLNQYDNILNLHDAFETERSLILVTELIAGTDLLDKVVADGNWTEATAADTVRKLLGILEILSNHNIQHLDIKPSNVYLCGSEGKDMKLMNFALSRQLVADEDIIHNYGSIGYASPEQVAEDIITDRTDIWGLGVLAYILLSGECPFTGTNDFEILNKTKTCDWSFGDTFGSFSQEARDFISKLLVKNPSDRLSVEDCLKHPWLTTTSEAKLNNEKLKAFYQADKEKREASKSFITANLQSFNKILHGASALYQPAMDQDSGEIIFPDTEEYGDFLSEDAWYEWQLHFMDDPDTQNFPLENKDFTVRESRHTAADDDDRQEGKKDMELSEIDSAIMFRNKIQTTSFIVGEDVTFTCTVISPNSPAVVTWYRDEQLLSEDAYRTEAKYSEETGEASLTITNLKDYDAAIYKCVARNKDGRVACEARLLLGDVPGKPGRPVITQTSGSEVFLTWTGPVSDGNSYILGYRTDFKKTGEEKWTRGPFVTEEYALVSGLVPSSQYIFRVSCRNKYGASQYSWASLPVTTGDADMPKIEIAKYLRPLLQFSSYDKQQLILQAASRRPSLTVAADATLKEGKPEDSYNTLETVSKGSYGEYKLCSSKASNKQYVMKIMPFSKDSQDIVMHEFNILSKLRQVNIVNVFESFISGETFYVIFERLSGINVVQYLCLRKFYSEEIVSRIVRQILDGLQYLRQLGVVHLNLQPSSVVMATRRRLHVKLRDFTQARKIESGKEEKIAPSGYPDFIAPELLREEPVGFPADVWSLGALTFVMLSGTSPFGGADQQETLNRIVFDRYCVSELYDNVSKEAISFVRKMLKRLPKNRNNVTKCLESRWLQLTDSMIKSRTSRLFRTETLRDFSTLYLERRGDKQYMDMSGVTGESLAKPTVGPLTEPVLSRKIPKYTKPITRLSQEKELEFDSVENVASDFKSVLNKIESLRTALILGEEIPEWETKLKKPTTEIVDIERSAKEIVEQDNHKEATERKEAGIVAVASKPDTQAICKEEIVKVEKLDSVNVAPENKLEDVSPVATSKLESNKDIEEMNKLKLKATDKKSIQKKSQLEETKEAVNKVGKNNAKIESQENETTKSKDMQISDGKSKTLANKDQLGVDLMAKVSTDQNNAAPQAVLDNQKKIQKEAEGKSVTSNMNRVMDKEELKPKADIENEKQHAKSEAVDKISTKATTETIETGKSSLVELKVTKEKEETKELTMPKEHRGGGGEIKVDTGEKSSVNVGSQLESNRKETALLESKTDKQKTEAMENVIPAAKEKEKIEQKEIKTETQVNKEQQDSKIEKQKSVATENIVPASKEIEQKAIKTETETKIQRGVAETSKDKQQTKEKDISKEKEKQTSINEESKNLEIDSKQQQRELNVKADELGQKEKESKAAENIISPSEEVKEIEQKEIKTDSQSEIADNKLKLETMPMSEISKDKHQTMEKDISKEKEKQTSLDDESKGPKVDAKQQQSEINAKTEELEEKEKKLKATETNIPSSEEVKEIEKKEIKTETQIADKKLEVENILVTESTKDQQQSLDKDMSKEKEKQLCHDEQTKQLEINSKEEQSEASAKADEVMEMEKGSKASESITPTSKDEQKETKTETESGIADKELEGKTTPLTVVSKDDKQQTIEKAVLGEREKQISHDEQSNKLEINFKQQQSEIKAKEDDMVKEGNEVLHSQVNGTDVNVNDEMAINEQSHKQHAANELDEVTEELVKPLKAVKDRSVPNVKMLENMEENILSKSESIKDIPMEQKEPTVREFQETPVDTTETRNEAEALSSNNTGHAESDVPQINNLEEVAEEVIEARVTTKDRSLPNLEFKETIYSNQDKSKEESCKANESEDTKTVDESDKSTCENELKVDKLEDKIANESEAGKVLVQDAESKAVITENVISESDSVLLSSLIQEQSKNKDTEKSCTEEPVQGLESKDENLKAPKAHDSETELPSENEIIDKSIDAVPESIDESERKADDLSEEEKRRSMSTISTVSESEYLDALSCSDNKDLKCTGKHEHIQHESTPDSAYATPERDIVKRNSVLEEDTSKTTEITEKSDTEAVKEKAENTTDLEDQKLAEDTKATEDVDGKTKELNQIAEVEQISERLVTDAMDDAFKVAEKTE